MSHHDELPIPKTPEELRALAERKAAFKAEAERLRAANIEKEIPVIPTFVSNTNDRPRPFADDLRPADFQGFNSRILANRPEPVATAPRISPQEAYRFELVAKRREWLKGKNQYGHDRIVGMNAKDVDLVCESVGRAPRLDWHTGTVRAAEAAEAFMESVRDLPRRRGDKHTLILYGNNGLGKSVTMAWLFAELCYGEWLKPEDIHAGQEWEARKNSLMHGHIVYIDDLGREGSPFAIQQLGLIVERRHDAGRPTVITTNFLLSPDQREKVPANLRSNYPEGDTITERYGNRLHSRLMNGATLFAWLGGVDLRQTTRR